MTPVDTAVDRGMGVVLIEQMILPLPLDKTVGVVQPVGGRSEVILRAVRVTCVPSPRAQNVSVYSVLPVTAMS